MLRVTIKSIELENFKGFYNVKIDFDKKKTVLYGKSGCGKSTIKDAWLWVCGLDIESPNPSLDNQVMPDLVTRVSCRISTDKNEYTLSRVSKSKWKNTEDFGKVFNGFDASNYEFDSIPMNATTYRSKLCELFQVPKFEYLRFLCDSNFFNTDKGETWNYKRRREILFKVGNIAKKTAELNKKPEFELLKADLDKGLTTTEITKALNTSDRKLAETKRENTTRIQERASDFAVDYDFDELREQLAKLEIEYKNKNAELQDATKEKELIAIKRKIEEKQNLVDRLELADRQKQNSIELEKSMLNNSVEQSKNLLKLAQAEIKDLEKQKTDLDKSEFMVAVCPLCKQEIKTTVSKEQAMKDFEKQKKESLKALTQSINSAKKEFESKKEELENKLVRLNELNGLYFKPNEQIAELKDEIDKLTKESEIKSLNVDDKQIRFEIQSLENSIRDINSKLAFEKLKESAETRIRQLEKNNLEIAKLERANNLKRRANENYLLATVQLVNDSINEKFKNITWNLFDTYNADAEKNYKEECEVMFENKLYSQCSTGQKLIANFYTIIGLQKAFGVSLPIFFDEAQSSTFDRKCEQQLIELVTNMEETNIVGTRITFEKTIIKENE